MKNEHNHDIKYFIEQPANKPKAIICTAVKANFIERLRWSAKFISHAFEMVGVAI